MRRYRIVQHPMTKEFSAEMETVSLFGNRKWDTLDNYRMWWSKLHSARNEIHEFISRNDFKDSDYIVVEEYTSDNPPNHS